MIRNEKFQGGLLVFLGAASFGVLSSIVKTAYKAGYTVGEVTGVQTLFGMLILWILYVFYKKKNNTTTLPKKSKRNQQWVSFLVGIFPGLMGILYYQCVQLVPASIAIILLMQYLWISVIIDFIFFGNKPTQLQVIIIAVIIGGSCLAADLLNQNVTINLTGYLFGFLSALTYSLFITTSSRVGLHLHQLQKSALMITGACLVTFILFPPVFLLQFNLYDKIYQYGLWLAILGTALPPLFFSIGSPKIGIALSAILSAIELPVAVLASAIYLKESVSFFQWLGVAIIIFAVATPNIKAAIARKNCFN